MSFRDPDASPCGPATISLPWFSSSSLWLGKGERSRYTPFWATLSGQWHPLTCHCKNLSQSHLRCKGLRNVVPGLAAVTSDNSFLRKEAHSYRIYQIFQGNTLKPHGLSPEILVQWVWVALELVRALWLMLIGVLDGGSSPSVLLHSQTSLWLHAWSWIVSPVSSRIRVLLKTSGCELIWI